MLSHYIKLSFRQFRKNKISFIINIVGLTTGLASALFIFLWVMDEIGMDRYHQNDDRLFQVMENQAYAEGIMTSQSTPGPLAQALKDEIPEIEHAATYNWVESYTLSFGNHNFKKNGCYVGSDFFRMLSIPLIHGEESQVLSDWNSIVISESTAKALFGSSDDVVGSTIVFEHEEELRVSGVFEDLPERSSHQFDFTLAFEKYMEERVWMQRWDNHTPRTLVTLVSGTSKDLVEKKIENFIKLKHDKSHASLFLHKFSDRYLYGRYENGMVAGGRIEYVRLFSVIAIFILIIACINFMNLSTAKASLRSKEVGIKKTIGAGRLFLVQQFMTESLMLSFISLFAAIGLVWLLLPQFNAITEKNISLSPTDTMVAGFLGISLVTGLLAGSYPALYLTRFKPIEVIRNQIRRSIGEIWARKGLVVFQFALSLVLVIAVIVVLKQIHFVQSKNLGYHKDNLVLFPVDGQVEKQMDAFLYQAKQLPGVVNISTAGHSFTGRNSSTRGLDWDGKNPDDIILFEIVRSNYDLIETLEMELAQGRSFSRVYGSDSSKIIFNEAAIKVMGLDAPLGKRVNLWGLYDLEIIGVIKDFHFQSLHEEVEPLFFKLEPDNAWNVVARLEAGNEQMALTELKSFYEEFNPGFPFEYRFVDEQYGRQYAAEQRVASLSQYFAGLAILISCLGLMGLSLFTGETRRKEIGVRKVLGASVVNIISLLSKDFFTIIIFAILIGIPLSYLMVKHWLGRFAFHIDLSPWLFLSGATALLLLAMLTIGFQSYRSALAHPVESIRNE